MDVGDDNPQMDESRSRAAKSGGSWHLPTVEGTFGWLRRWNWMVTLFALTAVGIAGQKYFAEGDTTAPGQWPVRLAALWALTTIAMLSIKEFYERERERKDKEEIQRLLAEAATREAMVK